MARDTSPQCKQCRREGQKLFLKGERCLTDKCGVERRAYPPGEHGRGRQKQSEYRVQLREKQKARRYYGVLEKQFRRYYEKASTPAGHHRREPAAPARVPPRQRPRAPRLRRLAPPGPPAGPPRPLDGQRPPGRHPQLPGARGRRRSPSRPAAGAEPVIRDATELTAQVPAWLQADHDCAHRQGPAQARASRDHDAGAGAAHRRAVLEVTPGSAPPTLGERGAHAGGSPRRQTDHDEGQTRPMLDFQIPRITNEHGRRQPRLVRHRAARPRLRLHVRQLAAPRAAQLARRRRRHERPHRGRRPRVLDDQGRQGGRHRHRPEPQGHRLPHALRRQPRSRRRSSSPAPARSRPRTSTCPPASRSSTPTSHIATLEKKTKLELYLTIGRGRGYRPAEENKTPDQPIGVIPIDSIFSPVRRVAYSVEQARVGQRTDYDKLTLDIETDGSIDPQAALREASEILISPARDLHRRGPHRGAARRPRRPARAADHGRRRRRRRRLGRVARRPDGRHPHRGARARRALVQLPQARRHPDRSAT